MEIAKYAKKDDGTADTSKPIKGVEFLITGPDSYAKTFTTGANGKISLSDLTPGEYTVTETDVSQADPVVEEPSASERTQKITVEADTTKTASLVFSDLATKGSLIINKYAKDKDGKADTTKPISGVEFKVTGPDDYSKTVTTGEDGQIGRASCRERV